MRNISPMDGLLNNAPVKIKEITRRLIRVRLMSNGKIFPIPRITFDLYIGGTRDTRKQFPLRPGYAKTINRSHGATIDKCAIDLREHPFTHGQLYVALSRVRSREDIIILVSGENANRAHAKTRNVVYTELLDEMDLKPHNASVLKNELSDSHQADVTTTFVSNSTHTIRGIPENYI